MFHDITIEEAEQLVLDALVENKYLTLVEIHQAINSRISVYEILVVIDILLDKKKITMSTVGVKSSWRKLKGV